MGEKDPLSQEEIEARLKEFPEWKQEDKAIIRVQTFPQYKDALEFVYQVGLAAEEGNHHPDIVMNFKRVTVRYWTHTARGISGLDFKMASRVEKLVQKHYQDPRPKKSHGCRAPLSSHHTWSSPSTPTFFHILPRVFSTREMGVSSPTVQHSKSTDCRDLVSPPRLHETSVGGRRLL